MAVGPTAHTVTASWSPSVSTAGRRSATVRSGSQATRTACATRPESARGPAVVSSALPSRSRMSRSSGPGSSGRSSQTAPSRLVSRVTRGQPACHPAGPRERPRRVEAPGHAGLAVVPGGRAPREGGCRPDHGRRGGPLVDQAVEVGDDAQRTGGVVVDDLKPPDQLAHPWPPRGRPSSQGGPWLTPPSASSLQSPPEKLVPGGLRGPADRRVRRHQVGSRGSPRPRGAGRR